jgi:FKBP-type peptidyl-prolyl cis-trans isomerase 2
MVDTMRIYILILSLVLLLGCITPPPAENITNDTTIITPDPNATVVQPPPKVEDYYVQLGDTVWVNYTLWVNNEVTDTNNETLAKEAGIYNPSRRYQPFMYEVALNKGVIDGFVLNSLGMTINETITFNVDPKRGYGPYDPSKVFIVPRYYNMSKLEVIPRSALEEQGLNISKGDSFSTPYGTVFINDLNEENATLFYVLFRGDNFTVNGIPQTVSDSHGSYNITIEYLLDVNGTYVIPDPQTGMVAMYTVTNQTDQNITLDGNHPLANETLTFRLTLLQAMRPS